MKTGLFLFCLLTTPLALAQDFLTAEQLQDMSADLTSRIGANNAAILNNIFNEGSYFGAMVSRETGPGFSETHAEWADIYFVIEGAASIITGGESHRIGKGDIVHIPAGVPHYVVVGEGEAITYFIVKAQ